MNEFLKTLISGAVGGCLTILGNYVLEFRKSRNDRYKFSFEKVFSIGEEFYRYSGLAQMLFMSGRDSLDIQLKESDFDIVKVYTDVEQRYHQLAKDFASSNITITAANIFYGTSDVHSAYEKSKEINDIKAKFISSLKAGKDIEPSSYAILLRKAYQDMIDLISADRQKVKIQLAAMIRQSAHHPRASLRSKGQ